MRRRGLSSSLLLAGFAVSVAASAAAGDGMRCGSRLVREGDFVEVVQARCGNPTSRSTSSKLVTYREHSGAIVTREIPIEVWIYDRGSSSFVRRLEFRDGRLVSIRALDYGG